MASETGTDAAVYTRAVVPHDERGLLQPDEAGAGAGAAGLLSQSALVVTREIEMMNIFLGYEQANRYTIRSATGEQIGYLAEEEPGVLGGAVRRQLLRTHRPFRATVMNAAGHPVLLIRRPLTWINSKVSIYAVRAGYPVGAGPPHEHDLTLIGEVHQRWHLYRRRYELFLRRPQAEAEDNFEQFAQIDAGFLSLTFLLQDAQDRLVGAIDRNFRGFGRELFTDTGQYVLRFDSVGQQAMTDARLDDPRNPQSGTQLVASHGTRPLTLDERAVALATAVSIDCKFWLRHGVAWIHVI